MIKAFEPYVPIVDVDVATFEDATPDAALVKLDAAITPVQDLHGYANPWPAGGGKNKLPASTLAELKATNTNGTWTDNQYVNNGVTFTCNFGESGLLETVTASGTASSASVFVVYPYTASSFNSLILNGCPGGGSSDNSYKMVYQDQTASQNYDDIGSGVTVASPNGNTARVVVRIENGYAITGELIFRPMISTEGGSFAPYANTCPIIGFTRANAFVSPTLDAEDATVYPIDWTDDAGTVYKGSINFTTGELTVTHGVTDLGDLYYTKRNTAGAHWEFMANLPTAKPASSASALVDILCSCYPSISANDAWNGTMGISIATSGEQTVVFVVDENYSDADAFKTAVTGQTLVYELAAPVTYELTPVEVKTLEEKGTNNVWVSTGKIIELYYPIDIDFIRRHFMVNSGYILLDGGDIDLTDTDPQLIEGSWDRIVTAMETGKPIWAFNTKYGDGKPLSPVPVFAWYLSDTTIVIVGATLHIIVSNNDYCVVQDVAA